MGVNEHAIGVLLPEGVPLLIVDSPEVNIESEESVFARMQTAWNALPSKVKQVAQRSPKYSVKIKALAPKLYGNRQRNSHGEWNGRGSRPHISISPNALLDTPDLDIPEIGGAEMVVAHELYGHGLGAHPNYNSLFQRYCDYILAPNPWLQINELNNYHNTWSITQSAWVNARWGLASQLQDWVRYQLGTPSNFPPKQLRYSCTHRTVTAATSILLAGGQILGQRWQRVWPTSFAWRTPDNAIACSPTWRDAWVTPDAILPLEVMHESLEYALAALGVSDLTPDEYWRALKRQDQLLRPYSLHAPQEAIAEHLVIGAFGLAEPYQCSRVCRFLESATDIILSEDYPPQCFCGEFITNPQDQYCTLHQRIPSLSVCGVCKTPITNPFASFLPNFIGVCANAWCQKMVTGTIKYQQVLSGIAQEVPAHHHSLEIVDVDNLTVGDKVVLAPLGEQNQYVLLSPEMPQKHDSLHDLRLQITSDIVQYRSIDQNGVIVDLRHSGTTHCPHRTQVFRSQLPKFELLADIVSHFEW